MKPKRVRVKKQVDFNDGTALLAGTVLAAHEIYENDRGEPCYSCKLPGGGVRWPLRLTEVEIVSGEEASPSRTSE